MTTGHTHTHEPRRGHRHADMLSVEEAFERIMSYFSALDPEDVPILQALGQTLAEDVTAPLPDSADGQFGHGRLRVEARRH